MGGGGVLTRSLAGGGLEEVFNGDPLTKTMIQSPLTCGQVTAQVDFNLKWCMGTGANIQPRCMTSLIPRLSRNTNMYRRESLGSFLRKHDVIKIGLKQKGNVLCVVQLTMHSTLGVGDIQPLIIIYR